MDSNVLFQTASNSAKMAKAYFLKPAPKSPTTNPNPVSPFYHLPSPCPATFLHDIHSPLLQVNKPYPVW